MSSAGRSYGTVLSVVAAACAAALSPAAAVAQTSAFTYQGRLDSGGSPVNGSHEFEFTLWNAPAAGAQTAGPDLATAVVADGLFTAEVDFGNAEEFLADSWLEIRVRPLPAGVFQLLTPRQRITPAPTSEVAALARRVEMFPAGVANPDRMIISHSPANSNWGLQYQDAADAFRFLNAGTPVLTVDLAQRDVRMGDASSLFFPNPLVTDPPMIHMFASGSASPDRMVIAHSPAFPNWGLQYQDATDTFRFLQTGSPVLDVGLQSREVRLGVGTSIRCTGDLAPTDPAVIQLFETAAGNARMVIAHSPALSNMGLNFLNAKFNFIGFGNPVLTIDVLNGSVGVNTLTPSFDLHVNGTAGKPGGGSWAVASDQRLKTNVHNLHGALERLLALRGVTFEFKDPAAINELPGTQTGMIAQEVERVFPEWIAERPDGYKSLSPRGFEALTVEALRELRTEKDAQIERLNRRVEGLTADNAGLRARLEALEAAIANGMR